MQAFEQLAIALAASLMTISCASTAPAPDTGLEPEQAPAPVVREMPRPAATTPVRARFTYAPGTISYVVTTEATINEISSAFSAARRFHEVARVQVTIAPAGADVVTTTTGWIDSTAAARLIKPFVDTLRAENVDAAGEPRMPICGRDTVPPMHLVTLLPPVPQELREGVRWQRRQLYASCQGTIPVRVERADSYVVAGGAPQIGPAGATITRSSSFAFAGVGVEGQHNIRLAGSGAGQATLVFDTAAGRLVDVVEENLSEIHITASGRTRRFSQRIARTARIR